jgi:hypothetical protein
MKTIFQKLFLIILCVISLNTFAQKPETVYSIVRVVHDLEWYKQQAKAWKQEIDNGTNDKMAWVNFYRANRMARFAFSENNDQNKVPYLLPLDQIIKMAENAIPNSFELYYLEAYEYGCYTERGQNNLMKAQEARPFDRLMLSDLMNYYQIKRDTANIKLVSKKWFESNETPEGILNFNYNVLMSLEENAVLLVNGDNATYPIWILQQAKQIRKDVLVLNVSLLGIDGYRNKIFQENSITPLDSVDAKNYSMKQVIKHIIENLKNRPVYLSINMDQDLYKEYVDSTYLIGLAFKFSDKSFNNMAVLQNNFENKFLLDYLKINFSNDYAQSVVNQMNLSYLAVFLKLYEQYQLSGEIVKAKKVKELAKTVSTNCGNTSWLQYFKK